LNHETIDGTFVLLAIIAVVAASVVWEKSPEMIHHPDTFLIFSMIAILLYGSMLYFNMYVLVSRFLLFNKGI
jgi:hypothetical protein